jgi:hypothetical protein
LNKIEIKCTRWSNFLRVTYLNKAVEFFSKVCNFFWAVTSRKKSFIPIHFFKVLLFQERTKINEIRNFS